MKKFSMIILFYVMLLSSCNTATTPLPLPTDTALPASTFTPEPTSTPQPSNSLTISPTSSSLSQLQPLSLPEFNARYSTRDIALTPNRQIMAVVSKNKLNGDESVWLWNVNDFDHSLAAYYGVVDDLTCIALSPDENKLAMGGKGGILILDWKARNLINRIPLLNPKDYASRMAFSSNDILLSSDSGGELTAWNLETGEVKYSVEISPSLLLGNFVISPDGQTLLASRYDEIHFWDLATGKSTKVIADSDLGLLSSFAYSPDGKLLATGGCGLYGNETCLAGKLYIWKYPFENPSINISRHSSNIAVGEFNPSNNLLVVASGSESVEFFDLQSGQFIHAPPLTLRGKLPPNGSFLIFDSQFLSDGKALAVSTNEGIQLLDISNMSWTPNLRFILSLGYSYTVTSVGDNLNFRKEPSMNSEIIKKLHTGDWFRIIDGPKIVDGYVWWKVRIEDDTEGWIVEMPAWYEFIP